jgi:hypothetical protein
MSTIGDVVNQAGTLVTSVQALLDTDTVKGVVEAAAALGAQQMLQDGFTALQGGINKIGQGLNPVASTLIGVDAAAGMLGLVPPLVQGIGTLISDSGDLFVELVPGLDAAKQVAGSAEQAINAAGTEISAVSQFADDTLSYVDPTSFKRLSNNLQSLVGQLENLKKQAANPPSNA